MKKRYRLFSWLLAAMLALLPVLSASANKDVNVAGVYEKAMDEALKRALLLELDTTAGLLKGQKGRAVAAALVSLLKAANEIEFDGSGDGGEKSAASADSGQSGDKQNGTKDSASKKLPDGAYTRAAKYGEMIRDVDTQLIYCQLLKKEGYDLTKVYPDGVEVDIDLRQYQPFSRSSGANSNNPKLMFDFLIFSREDTDAPALRWSETTDPVQMELETSAYMDIRSRADYGYRVKLRVDLMQNEKMDNLIADSLASCKSYILIDRGYLYGGRAGYTVTRTNSPVTYHYGPKYNAFEAIYLISVADPTNIWLWDSYTNESPHASAVTVMDGSENPMYVFSYTDENGSQREEQIMMADHAIWYTDRYVVGKYRKDWLSNYLKRENGMTGVEALILKYAGR